MFHFKLKISKKIHKPEYKSRRDKMLTVKCSMSDPYTFDTLKSILPDFIEGVLKNSKYEVFASVYSCSLENTFP